MKTILILFLLAFATLSAHAQGGFYRFADYPTSYTGGTNVLPALSTNSYITIALPKTRNVTLYFVWNWHASPGGGDSTSPKFELYRGISDTLFETNVWQTIVLPASATTATMTVVTNVEIASIPYIRGRFANVGTNAIGTNVLLRYGFKN